MNDSDTPQPADGQCAFFLPKKKRFCRFRPNQGLKYCAEHACVLGVELDRKRIVCPLNPKHTCYEDNLDKHLKKCNSRKRRTEDYYEEGINTGTDDGDSVPEAQPAVKATDTGRLRKLIDRVNQLYEEHIGTVAVDIRSHECLREEMDNPYYGLSALRHRRQQASLIGQLDGLGLLAPGHCYVEMGAGKGQLSHWVRQAVSCHDDAAFLLVDRSSIRYKVDGYHKEEEKVKFERVKVDIEHLNLGKVPTVANSGRPLVAIGKHLCGAATDLTLRCLMKTVGSGSADLSSPEPRIKRLRTTVNAEKPSDSAGVAKSQSLPGNSVAGSGDAAGSEAREDGRQGTVCGTAPAEGQTAVESRHSEHTQTSKCAAHSEHAQTSKYAADGEHTQTSKYAADGEHTQTSKYAADGEHTQTSKYAADSEHTQTSKYAADGEHTQTSKCAADGEHTQTSKCVADGEHTQTSKCAADGEHAQTSKCAVDSEHTQTSKCAGHSDQSMSNTNTARGVNVTANNLVVGVLIALCCHHQCRWQAYVGKEFMRQCGITAADFSLLTRLSSWAVCGWRDRDGSFGTKKGSSAADKEVGSDNTTIKSAQESDPADGSTSVVEEEMEHNTEDLVHDTNKPGDLQLSEKEKEAVGWRCKRLIDYGRALYLRRCGLHSDLKVYIDSRQTPENVVLIATPSEKT